MFSMKRLFFTVASCLLSMLSWAQIGNDDNQVDADGGDNATDIVTVGSIIDEEQHLTQRKLMDTHFKDVWERRSYFNIMKVSGTLEPKKDIELGIDDELVPSFKSDWGVALMSGRNYRLHKYAIANTLQFYFDYTPLDLTVMHYNAEKREDGFLYDSRNEIMPWCLEKYEASYGMNLGPSITLAPFNYLYVKGLHYIKINVYYHIGYHASVMYLINDEDADIYKPIAKDYDSKFAKNTKLEWGHGMTSSFGFNISWKFIGLGFETRKSTLKYKAVDTDAFGGKSNDFKTKFNRFFLQFRF